MRGGNGDGSKHEAATTTGTPVASTEISLVYSSEEQDWMESAVAAFGKQHPEIVVKLEKLGSLEAGSLIVNGRQKPVLWSPADSDVLNLFAADWKASHGTELVKTTGDDAPQKLLLTPIVWVAWEERAKSLAPITWHKLHDAIASDHLKLGHTDPSLSSTGLIALVSMAAEFFGDKPVDLADPAFAKWFGELETGVAKRDVASTGTLAKMMIELGPSQVEVGVLYESNAVGMFDKAKTRWGKSLRVEYPGITFWSDHPIAQLAGDWVKPAQAAAAHTFVAFLRSKEIQQTALKFGFRSADVDVPLMTDDPENPFKKYAANGVKLDIPAAHDAWTSTDIDALLGQWKRLANR
jgi:ABC-type Fe3+ transport system substrate-binding protein